MVLSTLVRELTMVPVVVLSNENVSVGEKRVEKEEEWTLVACQSSKK
jgi:hypothetical protein